MTAENQTDINLAELIATVAHAAVGQRRKHSGIAYINHPADVVAVLQNHCTGLTAKMLMAAWMHDVVEDTQVGIDFIHREFGTAVSRMVFGLTNERPEGMNRAERHAHNTKRLAACAFDVKSIKMADGIANMRDIIREDPKFAPVYLREKRVLWDEALVGGCPVLWAIGDKLINDFLAKELDAA